MGFFDDVERSLDLPPARKQEVLRELKSHCAEAKQALLASGMSEAEASAEAERQMGDSKEVAEVIATAHNTASWKSALLAAVPFLAAAPMSMYPFAAKTPSRTTLSVFAAGLTAWAVICLVAVVRELLKGRRSAWLATWTASAFLSVPKALQHVALAGTGGRAEHLLIWLVIPLALANSAAILAGIWRVPKWRIPGFAALAVSVLTSLAFAFFLGTVTSILQLVVWLELIAGAVLGILFAFAVFAEHRSGSTAHAALFLLAWSSLPVGSVVIAEGWQRNAYLVALPVIGLIAVLFARQPDWQRKMRVMWIGVSIRILCYAVQCGLITVGTMALATWLRESLLIVATCIAAPIIYEHCRKARLQAQQSPTATA